jgi:signal transduction histidine kinase
MERGRTIYLNYSDHYAQTGDFENAYKYHVLFKNLSDTILKIDVQKEIAQLKLAYDIEKQRAENFKLKSTIFEKNYVVERRTSQRNSYLFVGLGIILVLVFFILYYTQRTRKNRIISEQRIRQLEEEKKLLAARSIVMGQEEERKRIAQELHDGLGVLLSSARMHFTSIRDKTPEAQPLLEKAAKMLEQASGDVRRISHNMMPGLLTKYGFYEAAEDLFEQVGEMEGIHAEVSIKGEQERLPENTEIMLYRILQEMMNNTLKHSGASNVKLEIEILRNRLSFTYSDDGKGFDLDEKLKQKSIGLTGLQSRVKFLGGELMMKTAPGKGVLFIFDVPI